MSVQQSWLSEINGVQYEWADLRINILGETITGVTGITYAEDQTIENVYGIGPLPVGRGYGKITPSASITLHLSTVEAMRKFSPTGRLQDIKPFDIIVNYLDADTTKIVKHTIRNAQFKTSKIIMKDVKQTSGAGKEIDGSPQAFELIISHIEWK